MDSKEDFELMHDFHKGNASEKALIETANRGGRETPGMKTPRGDVSWSSLEGSRWR